MTNRKLKTTIIEHLSAMKCNMKSAALTKLDKNKFCRQYSIKTVEYFIHQEVICLSLCES